MNNFKSLSCGTKGVGGLVLASGQKKSTRKTPLFLWIGFVCTTVKEYLCLLTFKIQLACSRGFEIEMMLRSDICSPFSTCHSHSGLHCHTTALDAHNMTKQTSYCRVKLWQHGNTCVFAHLHRRTNTCFWRLLQFQTANKEIIYPWYDFPDPRLASEQNKCLMFHNISTLSLGKHHN